MTNTYKVLSIEAWVVDSDNWTWNTWYTVGSIDVNINAGKDTILGAMYNAGFITQIEGGGVDDDGYNLVIIDENTGEPLFAIEYGNTL